MQLLVGRMVANRSMEVLPTRRGLCGWTSVGLLEEGWRVTGEIAWLRESPVQKLALKMC